MAAPGFYENLEAARPLTDRHQTLMWEVGDLIAQWEALQNMPRAAVRNVTSENVSEAFPTHDFCVRLHNRNADVVPGT